MIVIEAELDADYLIRALQNARQELTHPDKLLTSISLALKKVNDERHDAGLDPDGSAWTPLKPATIARKKNPKMLVEHGDMLRFYSRTEGHSVVIGTVDKKAYWHHAGTSRGLPARRLVGYSASDSELTKDIVEDYLQIILSRLR
jgi:phage virion morphogenesis protein